MPEPEKGVPAINESVSRDPRAQYWVDEIEKSPYRFESAPLSVQRDKSVVIHAIRKDFRVFAEWMPAELREDKDIVLAAVSKQPASTLNMVSPVLKEDRDVMVAAVSTDVSSIKALDKKFRADRELVRAGIRAHTSEEDARSPGYNSMLRYASEDLRDDKELVKEAVGFMPYALEYASPRLRDDKEVVIEAAKNPAGAFAVLEYASARLTDDKDVVLAIVSGYGRALDEVPESFKRDKDVAMAAVQNDGWALAFVSKELADDRDVVFAAVRSYPGSLQFASSKLRGDKELVLEAVKRTADPIKYASKELQQDSDVRAVAKKSFEQNKLALEKFIRGHETDTIAKEHAQRELNEIAEILGI